MKLVLYTFYTIALPLFIDYLFINIFLKVPSFETFHFIENMIMISAYAGQGGQGRVIFQHSWSKSHRSNLEQL